MRLNDLLSALLTSPMMPPLLLANQYPGGEAAFIQAMNQRATKLHLTHTQYFNSVGYDQAQQLTTARDLGYLAQILLHNQLLGAMVGTKQLEIRDASGIYRHLLINTNQLLDVEQGIKGVKTGTTPLAGEVLVSLVEQDGHQIIIVLLNSRDRYAETRLIINWIFKSYQWLTTQEMNKEVK
jgi:D-alanyl-D-alanine carboxypeptidase (penicillin-binding protein 5/6)